MNFFEQIEVNLITDAGAYTDLEISLVEIWVLSLSQVFYRYSAYLRLPMSSDSLCATILKEVFETVDHFFPFFVTENLSSPGSKDPHPGKLHEGEQCGCFIL